MAYENNGKKVWTNQGWVKIKKPRRKLTIKLKSPQLAEDHKQYRLDYESAKINEQWVTDPFNPNWDWKEGYSKYGCADTKISPDTLFDMFHKKDVRFDRMKFLLKFIPFVNVEVIE
tara:strand:+ start:622 stop:969 length:348 start_codon:yes stop_codon:yes gene_type:complete